MRFKLELACDNAAFEGEALGHELARILRLAADRVEADPTEARPIMDVNGNRVGDFGWTKDGTAGSGWLL